MTHRKVDLRSTMVGMAYDRLDEDGQRSEKDEPLDHRQVVYPGTEDELTLLGYKGSACHTFFSYLLCLFSLGVVPLIWHWRPEWRVFFQRRKSSLSDADTLILQDADGQIEVAKIELDEVDCGFPSEYTVSSHSSNNNIAPQASTCLTQSPRRVVRFFIFRHLKYVWTVEKEGFVRMRGYDVDTPISMLLTDFRGYDIEEQMHRQQLYGRNQISVEVKSYMNLLITEVLNPFYVFQIASIILWSFDNYVLYASCIFLISCLSILVSLMETRKQSQSLHDMVEASNVSNVCVLRKTQEKTSVEVEMSTTELVPGDVVVIPPGGCVMPCDAVLISGNAIVNESMLTGESVPVTKTPVTTSEGNEIYSPEKHKRHTLFCGTNVIQTRYYGNAQVLAVVVRTGFNTAKGELVRAILYPRPLDFKFYKDAMRFILFLFFIASIGMGYSIYIYIMHKESVLKTVVRTLDIVTIVVPPALPAAMTVGTYYAQSRLKAKSIFCISPPRINVSGKIKLVCFDKTGTLTEDGLEVWGVMDVQKGQLGSPVTQVTNIPYTSRLVAAMATCHSLTYLHGSLTGDPLDLKMFEATKWELEEPVENDTQRFDSLIPTLVHPPQQQTFPNTCTLQNPSSSPAPSSVSLCVPSLLVPPPPSLSMLVAPESIKSMPVFASLKDSIHHSNTQIYSASFDPALLVAPDSLKSMSESASLKDPIDSSTHHCHNNSCAEIHSSFDPAFLVAPDSLANSGSKSASQQDAIDPSTQHCHSHFSAQIHISHFDPALLVPPESHVKSHMSVSVPVSFPTGSQDTVDNPTTTTQHYSRSSANIHKSFIHSNSHIPSIPVSSDPNNLSVLTHTTLDPPFSPSFSIPVHTPDHINPSALTHSTFDPTFSPSLSIPIPNTSDPKHSHPHSTSLFGPGSSGLGGGCGVTHSDTASLKHSQEIGLTHQSLEEPVDTNYDQMAPTVVKPTHREVYIDPPNIMDVAETPLEMPYEIGIVRQFPFSSSSQRMSVMVRVLGQPHMELYAKGAPEVIQNLCLPETLPANLNSVLTQYTIQGFRVIALAHRTLQAKLSWHAAQKIPRDQVECDLTFVGLLVLQNMLKPETTPVIKQLINANIRSVMVTGDNILTAISVARDCGMVGMSDRVLVANASPPTQTQPASLTFEPADTSDLSLSTSQESNVVVDMEHKNSQYHLAVNGRAWAIITKHFPNLVSRIVARGTVFARMSPDQKAHLVEELQAIDYVVAMCGDGANDCGALKTAHVGISLSEAEASVAAPFTSHTPNIECVPMVVCEGRCALTTNFSVFKYMALYSIIQFISVLILYSAYTNLSDPEFLYIDLCIVTVVAIFMGYTGPSKELVTKKPLGNLLGAVNMFSVLSQIALVIFFQVAAYLYLKQQAWFEPNQPTPHDEEDNVISWETAVIFYVSSFQYLTLCIAYSPGRPFRKPLYTNVWLTGALVVLTACTLIMLFCPWPWLMNIMNIRYNPDNPYYMFRIAILLIVGTHFVLSLTTEHLMANSRWLKKCFQWLLCKRGPKNKYKLVLQEMEDDMTWPPVAVTLYATPGSDS